jgi:hypothetical protein
MRNNITINIIIIMYIIIIYNDREKKNLIDKLIYELN